MTLGTLLKQGREILQNTGIAEWDLDAWYLLEYVTGVSRSQYFLDPEREVPQEQEVLYRQMIDKRSTQDRKSTRLNSSHYQQSRMPSSA